MSISDFLTHLLSFSSLAILLATGLAIAATTINPDKNKKAKRWFLWLTVLGAIILFGTGSYSSFQQDLLLEKIELKSSTNARLSRNNTKLNEEIRNYQTGGNSYVYIPFYTSADKQFKVTHVGKYPLYSLNIIITKLDVAKDFYESNKIWDTKRNTPYNYQVLAQSSIEEISLDFDKQNKQCFLINYSSNTRQWKQYIITGINKGKFEYGYIVVEFNEANRKWNRLQEAYSTNFPPKFKTFLEDVVENSAVGIVYARDPSKPINLSE